MAANTVLTDARLIRVGFPASLRADVVGKTIAEAVEYLKDEIALVLAAQLSVQGGVSAVTNGSSSTTRNLADLQTGLAILSSRANSGPVTMGVLL